MHPIDVVERYMWVFSIVIMTAVVLHVRRKLGLRDLRGAVIALLVTNLPWIILGAVSVRNPDITGSNAFSLRHGWISYLLIASVVGLWSAGFYWLFVRRGAERLAEVPVGLNLPRSASGIRLFYIACVCGGVLGLVMTIISER